MANTLKKKDKAKKAAVSAFLSILPILLIIIAIVAVAAFILSIFDWGDDEEVRRNLANARANGVHSVSGDFLEQLHVTEDGLEELLTYPDPAVWRPTYDVRLPYYLYVDERSTAYNQLPEDASEVLSDRSGYRKYVCYESITLYGPDLSKYALSWQDVYTVTAAIYLGELGDNVLDAESFRAIAPYMEPSVTYSDSVNTALRRLQTEDSVDIQEVQDEPYQPQPEITTMETITVTVLVTATPTPTSAATPTPTAAPTSTPTPTDSTVTPTPTAVPTNTPTPTPTEGISPSPTPTAAPSATPTPRPHRPHIPLPGSKDDPHTIVQKNQTDGTYAAPVSSPMLPAPFAEQEETTDAELTPTPTEPPREVIVTTEEITIVATIEQHYRLSLLPQEITTWSNTYRIKYPEENPLTGNDKVLEEPDGELLTVEDLLFRDAKVSSAVNSETIRRITDTYGVETEILELIPEFVTADDNPLLAASIGRLPEQPNVKQAYKVNVTLTQARTLDEMSWPLPGDQRLSGLFGPRQSFQTSDGSWTGSFHHGWDIGGEMGAPIVAALAGKVHYVGYHEDAGNYIEIDHGNGVITRYLHCSKILAKVGQEVMQNETIALVGSTGGSTAPHLHFALRINGTQVDPYEWIWPAMAKDQSDPILINEKGRAYKEGKGLEWAATH